MNSDPRVSEILSWHKRHAWQPFTQMKLAAEPVLIERGEGLYLITSDGRRIMDAVGSWWVSVHGHNHPRITERVKSQLDRLDQVMYAGFTHEPAAHLSYRLAEKTGGKLPRVFFSDNGACAVEIALKMAFQYFVNAGKPEKSRFVTLENGYHGDTIGTMAAGSRAAFHKMYEPLLFDVETARGPDSPDAIESLRRILEEKGREICGLILEPLIQGAGGMVFYSPEYLRAARTLCDQHDVFLIADEVFTGFGRTGSFFACEQAGIWPDIMALSKGLTAGVIPFAATLATEKVYQGFYSDDRMHTLFHGHSMTGNPAGCAAAHASLDLLDEQCLGRVKQLEAWNQENLKSILSGPAGRFIQRGRAFGSVAALDAVIPARFGDSFSQAFRERCVERGLLVRPLSNVVYLALPYVTTRPELDQMYDIMQQTLIEFHR